MSPMTENRGEGTTCSSIRRKHTLSVVDTSVFILGKDVAVLMAFPFLHPRDTCSLTETLPAEAKRLMK